MASIHWSLFVMALLLHHSLILALVDCMMLNVLLSRAVHIGAPRVAWSSLAANYSAHLSCLRIFFSSLLNCLISSCLMHLVVWMMGELFPEVGNVLGTRNLWKVASWELRWSSHNLNGLLFNHCLTLHVYRLDNIIAIGILIIFDLVRRCCH